MQQNGWSKLGAVALAALSLVVAARCTVHVGEDALFSCETDADCGGDGFLCLRDEKRSVCCRGSSEVCDGVDNDCDGEVDEGTNLSSDPSNCGACARVCPQGQACADGGCLVGSEGLCADALDNDQDGRADCLDSDCDGERCDQDGGCRCLSDGGMQEVNCSDRVDNDGEGGTDCRDAVDCAEGVRCGPASSALACSPSGLCSCNGSTLPPDAGGERGDSCGNAIDDDCDGTIDCADLSCDGGSCDGGCVCAFGRATERNCLDGVDNDGDGLVDCADVVDCPAGEACTVAPGTAVCGAGQCQCNGVVAPAAESACQNGVDDDCDGFEDCRDLSSCLGRSCGQGCACASDGGLAEIDCGDNVNNDNNDNTDCGDSDCAGKSCHPDGGCTCVSGQKVETACFDGVDNNASNGVDCADGTCTGQSCSPDGGCACASGKPAERACMDLVSNDDDTAVDCADGDCDGRPCTLLGRTCNSGSCRCNGSDAPSPEVSGSCADSVDNDCDGTIDCADVGCDGGSCGADCACMLGVKTETECRNANEDEDADGLVNCFDSDCLGRSCGPGSKVCQEDAGCANP